MTVPVAVPDWRERIRRLADQLTADGDLRSPAWRDALLAVPRHEFVPHYYVLDASSRPATWTRHEPHDPASTARWLELVYSPTTLVTALADYAGRGVQTGITSSTKPDLMIRMLEALQVSDGMRVLEIGTGTGYNAALLSHRLGDRKVCSIDIDPALVADARPLGMFRSIRLLDDQTPVGYLAAPDGSWCEIIRTPDTAGYHTVREAGPTLLWAAIETAWAQWTALGAPPWHEFGLTATPTAHHIWHRDPDTGPHWILPTPTA